MNLSPDEFLRRFSDDVSAGNAAIFAGAGLSIPAGFVDWRTLLREIAGDLKLHIDLETDLLAVAQYEYNRKRSRDSLNQAILNRFAREGQMSQNHRLIARLPVDTIWTTNYDKLIEEAFRHAGRRVDVKSEVEQLAVHRRDTEVTLYKMHGDVDHPHHAVLTKDDYECYETGRQAFITYLLSHLLSKRFLFLGFSFTDPNIEYTFNRLRRLLNPRVVANQPVRDHYCFLRKPHVEDEKDTIADSAERLRRHEANVARFEHRIADLQRYGLQTVQLDSYSDITVLLEKLHRRVSMVNVMVAGAADDYGPMVAGGLQRFCEELGRKLVEEGFNIVSGVGKGVGAELLVGAHQALGRPGSGSISSRLRLFPFPYWHSDEKERTIYFLANRAEMAAQAGVSIFISGNKRATTGSVVESSGVMAEFEEAKKNGHVIVPIGATGHAAKRIWDEVTTDQSKFFPNLNVAAQLNVLGDGKASIEQLLGAVFSILNAVRTGAPTANR